MAEDKRHCSTQRNGTTAVRVWTSFDRFDRCAEGLQALGEVGVATVYRVDVAEHALALGGEHADEQHSRGSERGRGFDIAAVQLRGTFYEHAVRVEKFGVCSELVYLQKPVRASVVHPVV